MPPEVWPLVEKFLAAILGGGVTFLVGYGALKSKVGGWDSLRTDDNKLRDAADLRNTQAIETLKEECERELQRVEERLVRRMEKAEIDIDSGLESQRTALSGLRSVVDKMQGRIDGQDAALARHSKGNEENPALGYTQHARDLVTDLERLVVKART
jgi:hypothetical protein